jgi:hypothetical protein
MEVTLAADLSAERNEPVALTELAETELAEAELDEAQP